jgi:hypothetical protein
MIFPGLKNEQQVNDPSIVPEKFSGGEIWTTMKLHELDAKDVISKRNVGDGDR